MAITNDLLFSLIIVRVEDFLFFFMWIFQMKQECCMMFFLWVVYLYMSLLCHCVRRDNPTSVIWNFAEAAWRAADYADRLLETWGGSGRDQNKVSVLVYILKINDAF